MASLATIDQNVDSIHPSLPRIAWSTADGDGGAAGPIKTANTTKDGTAGSLNLIFTAGSNGSILNTVRFGAVGTNVATVARIFLNNGSTPGTLANNTLWKEVSLPATTLTETEAQTEIMITGSWLPAGYRVYVVIGTTVAAGWRVSAEGGDY